MSHDLCQLADNMASCTKCNLHLNRINVVPGVGNPNADIVFIGEAPGAQENKQGEPFVGAAGKLLESLLEMVGWQRSDVYITNIVKDQPPGNRDPLPEEVSICTSLWLDKQIEAINPKIIVTLGRHAMYHFLPNVSSITDAHGRAFRKPDGKIYFPLYHPAVALYKPAMKEILQKDFHKLSKLVEILKHNNKK